MSQKDQNPGRGPLSGGREWFAIAPHASNDLSEIPRAVWVGTGGHLAVVGVPGSDPVVFKNIPNGTLLPIQPTAVRASGTTAADLVGIV